MKKLAIIFSLFALLVGCEQYGDLDQIGQNNEIENSGVLDCGLPETIHARVEDSEGTRAFVGDDKVSVLWHKGDAISYFGKKYDTRYVYNGEDGVAEADFNRDPMAPGYDTPISGDYTYAIYPYEGVTSISFMGNLLEVCVTYPSIQDYAEGSFGKGANVMIAREPVKPTNLSTASGYTFRHTGGYLVVKLYGKGVSVYSVTLTALDSSVKLAGKGIFTYSPDETVKVYMNDDSTATSEIILNFRTPVELGATKEEATEFWFALPAVTIDGGFKVKAISTNEDVMVKQTTKTVTIERGKVQPMAAIEFDPDFAPANQLFYTTSDGEKVDFSHLTGRWWPFNVAITDHTYSNGRGVITCEGPLKYINEEAFYDSELTSITFPDQLYHIGKNAFARTGLTSVFFPGSINEIMVDAFYKCADLTSVTFKPSPTGTPLKIGHNIVPDGTAGGSFLFSLLENINLNRELIHIDENGNTFVATFFPEGVFAKYEAQFNDEDYTLTVNFGEQVKTIHPYMFSFTRMTQITIPKNITTIGDQAFHLCKALREVRLEHTTPPTMVDEAFYKCYALSSILVPAEAVDAFKSAPGWSEYSDKIKAQ